MPRKASKSKSKKTEEKPKSTVTSTSVAKKKSQIVPIPKKVPLKNKELNPLISKVFKLSLAERDWIILEHFFNKKGLRTATGIKMILRDFIENGPSS